MFEYPLVSVLMPLYNKAAHVAEAIQSVLDQTYPNIELIIIDDGSTDNSFDIANSYISEKVFLFSQKNQGASTARNRAFECSKGDFIQYLDADDVIERHKIEEQIKLLRGQKEVLASAKMYYFRVQKDNTWTTIEMPRLERDYNNMTAFLLDEIPQAIFVHAWLMPRSLVQKAGKWDETMTIFDDRDFYLRLVPLASKIIYCEKSVCYYRIPDTSDHLSHKREVKDLEAALRYFSRFESVLLTEKHELYEKVRQTLACLYKKLLIISLKNRAIVDELRSRSIKLGLAPDCGHNKITQKFVRILGVRLTFQLIFLKLKYSRKNK